MEKIYVIKIGESFSPNFIIAGYATTEQKALDKINSMGYVIYSKQWGYWEKDTPGVDDGTWAVIESVVDIGG